MAKKKKVKAARAKSKAPSFEQALGQLEQIVEKIEAGSVSLEQGLEQYGQGMALIRHCRAVLDQAEQKIQKFSVEGDDLHAAGSADA